MEWQIHLDIVLVGLEEIRTGVMISSVVFFSFGFEHLCIKQSNSEKYNAYMQI